MEKNIDVIVSLTSYPLRITQVHKVINSLINQTEKPDEIILWLSIDEFPNGEDDLPESLSVLIGSGGFRIEWVNGNLKAHKKYYYALQDNSDNVVITVDDDIVYSQTLVHNLMESYRRCPKDISAGCVHRIFRKDGFIAPYSDWSDIILEDNGSEGFDLCAIGCGGILYPPGCANERWFDTNQIFKCAENQDDLWLKFNQIIDGIPTVYAEMDGKDELIKEVQDSALYKSNLWCGKNDLAILKLSELFRKYYGEIYDSWFDSLIAKTEFINKLKNDIRLELMKLFENNFAKHKFYIAGAGKCANILFDYLKKFGYSGKIDAFIVTEIQKNKSTIKGVNVVGIKHLDKNQNTIVICGVSNKYKIEFLRELNGFTKIKWIDLNFDRLKALGEING